MSSHFNMLVHRFRNTHSDNILIDSIDNVKRNEQQNLIIIGYDMTLLNIINWNQAKRKFESFLARHCNIDNIDIDVLGIVWNVNTCWYIMNATPRLRQALIPRQALTPRQALIPRQSNALLHASLGIIAGVGALVLLVTIFNPARK
ncbi:unnamed protein product [Adineta steineri]|uniref:Uncharacterized protein n=1 Tax=Adineta steineri TaxID=433720 RepID=A0A814BHT6_9BILA|nr:unnamed protein product [Adineta steineri]CAF0992616.1 unnamed protein product [Adineta steineri]